MSTLKEFIEEKAVALEGDAARATAEAARFRQMLVDIPAEFHALESSLFSRLHSVVTAFFAPSAAGADAGAVPPAQS